MFIYKLFTKLNLIYSRKLTLCSRNFSNKFISINDTKSLLENAATYEKTISDIWSSPDYPITLNKRSQTRHSFCPQINPKLTSVFLFPGQGSQYVGMAKSLIDYPNVKEMFEAASEILSYDLYDLCINGPTDMLNMTAHCQAAILVSSLAAVEKLRYESPGEIENCVATAGFSVGEYTALTFAGSLDFYDAIRLIKIRGEAMQAASDLRPSGMMTVFLKPNSKIKAACASAREWCIKNGNDDAECNVAIYLYPDCKVLSGDLEALKFLELNASNFGILKMKYIPVSGAFHSKIMLPAKQVLDKALKTVPFTKPIIQVYANVDGKPYINSQQIQEKLAKQLCAAVAWEQTMHAIFERSVGTSFPNTYECGPRSTLKSILKHNNAKAYNSCINVKA